MAAFEESIDQMASNEAGTSSYDAAHVGILLSPGERQQEALLGGQPALNRMKSGPREQRRKFVGFVFVGALGPDRLPFLHGHIDVRGRDAHALAPPADEMHLDARFAPVPDGAVAKAIDI